MESLGSCDLWTGGQHAPAVSGQSHTKLRSDDSRWLCHAAGMDAKAVKRAALMTVRRAILRRFPRN
jgi:hypothetical protein